MAKGKVGRPPSDDGPKGTRQVRVFDDIAQMISEILEVEVDPELKLTTATLLDPMIRAGVTARHAKIKHVIERLRKNAAQRESIIQEYQGDKPKGRPGS